MMGIDHYTRFEAAGEIGKIFIIDGFKYFCRGIEVSKLNESYDLVLTSYQATPNSQNIIRSKAFIETSSKPEDLPESYHLAMAFKNIQEVEQYLTLLMQHKLGLKNRIKTVQKLRLQRFIEQKAR